MSHEKHKYRPLWSNRLTPKRTHVNRGDPSTSPLVPLVPLAPLAPLVPSPLINIYLPTPPSPRVQWLLPFAVGIV